MDTTWSIYAGFLALLANLVVCIIATLVLRAESAEGETARSPTSTSPMWRPAGRPAGRAQGRAGLRLGR
jgi:hypothetical protein